MLGSVNSKNLVAVSVWNTVSRKNEDSRLSIPEGGWVGSGYVHCLFGRWWWVVVGVVEGSFGVRDLVMAWTPWNVPARTR